MTYTRVMIGTEATYNIFEDNGRFYLSLKVTRETSQFGTGCRDLLNSNNLNDAIEEAKEEIKKNEKDLITENKTTNKDYSVNMAAVKGSYDVTVTPEIVSEFEAKLDVVKVKQK